MPTDPLLSTFPQKFLAGVLVAMAACSKKLGRDPRDATVALGTTGKQEAQRPNFRVTAAGRRFIFQGGSHRPYSPEIEGVPDHVDGKLREGSFRGQNFTGEIGCSAVAAAAGDRPEEPDLAPYVGKLEAALDGLSVDSPAEDEARAEERERQAITRLIRRRAFRRELLLARERRCAVCEEAIEECLDAAHIWEVRDGGPDQTSNGLLLCALHHWMFDLDLFGIEPASHAVEAAPGRTLAGLRVTRAALDHGGTLMGEAVRRRWTRFRDSANGGPSPNASAASA